MSDNTYLGDRMKSYEQAEAGRRLMPNLPACVRIDGKGFSRFTRDLARPFDSNMSKAMLETTKYLVDETKAKIGYTQSDEISLILEGDSETQIFFDGKIQKLVSVLASMATAKFNSLIPTLLPKKTGELAVFDCRVWNVPNRDEAINTLIWREADATKNSVSMATRSLYEHKEMSHKSRSEMMDMLMCKGVNWNDYPAFFKRGAYVQRQTFEEELPLEKLLKIPEAHRPTPGSKFSRSHIVELDMPPIMSVVNREAVIFECAAPNVVGKAYVDLAVEGSQ